MLFCILMMVISILRFHIYVEQPPPDTLTTEAVTLQGRVVSYEIRNGQTILYLSDVFFYGESANGISNFNSIGVCCYLIKTADFKLGQTVAVQGFLALPEEADNPGGFDARAYYRGKGCDYLLYEGEVLDVGEDYDVLLECLDSVKQYGKEQLEKHLKPEDAGIMKAMLLGDKSEIDSESKMLYRNNGIYHILAISGLHISMLGGCLYKILKRIRIKPWLAAGIALLFIFLYGIMIGMPPSAFRAIVMYGFGVFAPLLCRSHDRLTSLAVAGACLLAGNPALFYDAGVRLSFLAVLGIVCLYPTFLGVQRHHMKVADGLWVSFAISYMTLPVIMQTYYEIPIYSLLINVCVLPFVPVLIGLGIVIIILGPLGNWVVWVPAWVIHYILFFYEILLKLFARLPGNRYVTGYVEDYKVIIFYAVLGCLIYFVLKIKRKYLIRSLKSENDYAAGRQKKYVCEQKAIRKNMLRVRMVQMAVMTVLIVFLMLPESFGSRISFLDVGQGDCVCAEINGKVYMIDGGSTSESGLAEYTILPFLNYSGIRRVDAWFLTHSDQDHVSGFMELCGMEDLGGIEIKTLYIPAVLEEEFMEVKNCAQAAGIEVVLLEKGDVLKDKKAKWHVLSPENGGIYPDENAASLVLYLEYEETDVLFMGDAGTYAEQIVMQAGIKDVEILKVAHHGSAVDTNSVDFIEQMSPEYAVISCRANNVYGHPHGETLERLLAADAVIMTTPECGAVVVEVKEGVRVY